MTFPIVDIVTSALAAGLLASLVLAIWRWARERYTFALAGITTFMGFAAWNLTLNVTHAVPNFNHDAPVVAVSWADAGSSVLAFAVTALVLGLLGRREEAADKVLGAAAVAGLMALIVDLFVL